MASPGHRANVVEPRATRARRRHRPRRARDGHDPAVRHADSDELTEARAARLRPHRPPPAATRASTGPPSVADEVGEGDVRAVAARRGRRGAARVGRRGAASTVGARSTRAVGRRSLERLVPDLAAIVGEAQHALDVGAAGGRRGGARRRAASSSSGASPCSTRTRRAVRGSRRRSRRPRARRAEVATSSSAGASPRAGATGARRGAALREATASVGQAGDGGGHLGGRREAIPGRLGEGAQRARRRAAGASPGRSDDGAGGASPRCCATRSGPRKGGRPVSAWNSVTPSA